MHQKSAAFADRIKGLRDRTGWSQERLAQHLGVSKPAVQQYERGRRANPRRSVVLRLEELERDPGAPFTVFGRLAQRHGTPMAPESVGPDLRSYLDGRFAALHDHLARIEGALAPRRLTEVDEDKIGSRRETPSTKRKAS